MTFSRVLSGLLCVGLLATATACADTPATLGVPTGSPSGLGTAAPSTESPSGSVSGSLSAPASSPQYAPASVSVLSGRADSLVRVRWAGLPSTDSVPLAWGRLVTVLPGAGRGGLFVFQDSLGVIRARALAPATASFVGSDSSVQRSEYLLVSRSVR